MALSVAHCGFGVDPNARSESCTHRILLFTLSFFPSSNSVHYCKGIRELRFCLDCDVQIELILHEKRPELFHDIFFRELGPRTQFCVWPNSSCFLVRRGRSFLPIPLYRSEFLCTLVLQSPGPGASAKTYFPASRLTMETHAEGTAVQQELHDTGT